MMSIVFRNCLILNILIMSMLSSQPMPEQPEILLQLRQKAAELRSVQASLRQNNKLLANGVAQASDELNTILREKEVQERKSRSLMLLVSDIQRQVDDFYSAGPAEDDEEILVGENKVLRELLVKQAERAKEDQKIVSFLRQASASGPKAQEFLHRSKYLESQTELLTKLRSQIASFSNANLECSRKWSELTRETVRLQREEGFIRIQSERIKTQLREYYEEYLQALNRSKASLVNFNQTQRERVITEHLVEQVALLQEKRVLVQEQSRNLKHHQQALLQQNARILTENRELRSFFLGPTGEEEQKLASKMRARIEELRDSLVEVDKQRMLPQLPVSNLAETVRGKLRGLEETAAYIEKKVKEEEQGKISLEEKDVVTFFEGVLRGRDERLHISRERQAASGQRLKELRVKRELLLNQISNLEEGMRYHNYEHTSLKVSNGGNPSRIPTSSLGVAESGSLGRVQKWRDRKMHETNILTTTSKFVPG